MYLFPNFCKTRWLHHLKHILGEIHFNTQGFLKSSQRMVTKIIVRDLLADLTFVAFLIEYITLNASANNQPSGVRQWTKMFWIALVYWWTAQNCNIALHMTYYISSKLCWNKLALLKRILIPFLIVRWWIACRESMRILAAGLAPKWFGDTDPYEKWLHVTLDWCAWYGKRRIVRSTFSTKVVKYYLLGGVKGGAQAPPF